MKKIFLSTTGKYALVDAEDYIFLSQWKWHLRTKRYAGRRLLYSEDSNRPFVTIGHALLQPPKGYVVDHINGNTLDDRRCNLRVCTQQNNTRNKGFTKNNNFRGIYLRHYNNKKGNKTRWIAKINIPYQKVIGTFSTDIEAARAYDIAAIKYFGEFARLNFPKESLSK